MLTKQDKKDVGEIVQTVVNDLIDNVLLPSFDLLATKTDLKKVEIRLDVVERKVDRVIDNQLEDQGRLLEQSSVTATS